MIKKLGEEGEKCLLERDYCHNPLESSCIHPIYYWLPDMFQYR